VQVSSGITKIAYFWGDTAVNFGSVVTFNEWFFSELTHARPAGWYAARRSDGYSETMWLSKETMYDVALGLPPTPGNWVILLTVRGLPCPL
jgi:hypothetical protein